MTEMRGLTRRAFGGLAAAAAVPLAGCTKPVARLEALEKRIGGRVGVAALNTRTGATLVHRADERFALCSTFKWMLAAVVLRGVDQGRLALDQSIPIGERDLLAYAPVLKAHVADGAMTIAALCQAMAETGDNAAANLLLRRVRGPRGFTDFAHSIGDHTTRLDRYEPALNSNIQQDPRDTTTPEAMLATMQKVLVGDVLTAPSREQLLVWMKACKTGFARLRAGLPKGWTVGDKTGTGDNGAAGDVAIAWPSGRPPILIVAYLSDSKSSGDALDAAFADIGRILAASLA